MGMFDSFFIRKFDSMALIQTKKLERSLKKFSWLEKVDKSPKERLYIISEYGFDDFGPFWVNFVILNGFFVDYCIYQTQKKSQNSIEPLTSIWHDFELQSYAMSAIANIHSILYLENKNEKENALRIMQDLIFVTNYREDAQNQLGNKMGFLINHFIDDGVIDPEPLKSLEKKMSTKFSMALDYYYYDNNFSETECETTKTQLIPIYDNLMQDIRNYIKTHIQNKPELIHSNLIRKAINKEISHNIDYDTYADFIISTKPSISEIELIPNYRSCVFENLDKIILENHWIRYISNTDNITTKEKEQILKAISFLERDQQKIEISILLMESGPIKINDYYNNLNLLGHLLYNVIKYYDKSKKNTLKFEEIESINRLCALQDYHISDRNEIENEVYTQLRQSGVDFLQKIAILREQKKLEEAINFSKKGKPRKI